MINHSSPNCMYLISICGRMKFARERDSSYPRFCSQLATKPQIDLNLF